MAFVVRNSKGTVDKRKTNALVKQLEKACQNINRTIVKEITTFKNAAKAAGVDESFWRASAHRAMLTLHRDNMDVWLSAEFGDLFGNADLYDPQTVNSWIDVERLETARVKMENKAKKKEKK